VPSLTRTMDPLNHRRSSIRSPIGVGRDAHRGITKSHYRQNLLRIAVNLPRPTRLPATRTTAATVTIRIIVKGRIIPIIVTTVRIVKAGIIPITGTTVRTGTTVPIGTIGTFGIPFDNLPIVCYAYASRGIWCGTIPEKQFDNREPRRSIECKAIDNRLPATANKRDRDRCQLRTL